MTKENKKDNKKKKRLDLPKPGKGPKISFYWIYGAIALGFIGLQYLTSNEIAKRISWQDFEQKMLKAHDVREIIVVNKESVLVFIKEDRLSNEKYKDVSSTNFGTENNGPHYTFEIGSVEVFEGKMAKAQKNFSSEDIISVKYETRRNVIGEMLQWLFPLFIIIAIWLFFMRRMSGGGMGGGAGQIFSIGKSKATLFDKGNEDVNVTFKDVAGLEEAKEEVMEVVDFLTNPDKYTALGGKIPKGALLIGAPGTGKTLLAKAMAGEAKVPFFSISGSDFVEMFVGVGASRVRDLFKQAREKAPCIIFIDEIDAIGRARGKSAMQGGNDERENTLNQLLVEMDGFKSEKGVIILAATNRPDVLDPALLRPGRFDRQISIDKPDIKGREEIFEVHLKPLKKGSDIDAEKLAAQTPGFAGAEIANVCNEAALMAARKNHKEINMKDFQDAIDRVIGGLEKKNKIISPEEKKIIAFHEAGHAVCGWFLEHADPLVKVTIVPRGIAALGYAQYLPKEQFLHTKEQLIDSICMALGGRVAEDIIFGKVSTGAQNDLERITKMAYAMVSIYGMSDSVGNVSFYDPQNEYGFTKPYSDETAKMIDEEVRDMIDKAYARTKNLLSEKRKELDLIAKELLETEILFKSDLERLIGKRPFKEEVILTKKEAAKQEEKKKEDAKSKTTDTVDPEKPTKENAAIEPNSSSATNLFGEPTVVSNEDKTTDDKRKEDLGTEDTSHSS